MSGNVNFETKQNKNKNGCSSSTGLYFMCIYLNVRIQMRGYPRGVMVKAMDCGIVVREFVLQSHYYVHFRANTLGKGMNPLIIPAMG